MDIMPKNERPAPKLKEFGDEENKKATDPKYKATVIKNVNFFIIFICLYFLQTASDDTRLANYFQH